ncbi:NtaA/DmoA family FMN-dependent monooxygenase [Quadrisphaera setariae]|uniref:NtaA/DmoA family FMN-dependent monooxygenase n=1 Tax=Quadrisphaera setariae TaxID=2593304 RepID=A0A5C8Z7G3_9ACTN|nr:NtaA/DmoA family FMN-dependent monooxygenase [Quadrisphaera setariae]TXR52860.1 NtaA/DmoA family FMN-dependent monooxygenase [Quadrisphaera setariae]
MSAPRPLVVALYEQASVGCGGAPGLWTHPTDDRVGVNSLDRWRHVATTAQQAGLHALFLADVLGLYDVYEGSLDAAIGEAVEAPANDPFAYVPALAEVARDLAFVVTASTTYEHPFSLARRFATLDHLTGGRIGWNVVTSYLESAARSFGLEAQLAHADRYGRADEFLHVTHQLWETSWDDDAVVADKAGATWARPGSVRAVHHDGEHFRVHGPALTSPSPQRTPVLFQAGWSPRGREFGARHGEVLLLPVADPVKIRGGLDDVRGRAAALGRDPGDLRALALARVVVGRTEAEAQAKHEDLQSTYRLRAQLVSYSGDTGIDLSRYADDEPLSTVTNGLSSYVLKAGPGSPPLTAGEVRQRFSSVARGGDLFFVGTPDQVADAMGEHAAAAGLDGLILNPLLSPGTLEDFAELAVPALTARGLYDPAVKTGTLRSRVRGDGRDRLHPSYPALQPR